MKKIIILLIFIITIFTLGVIYLSASNYKFNQITDKAIEYNSVNAIEKYSNAGILIKPSTLNNYENDVNSEFNYNISEVNKYAEIYNITLVTTESIAENQKQNVVIVNNYMDELISKLEKEVNTLLTKDIKYNTEEQKVIDDNTNTFNESKSAYNLSKQTLSDKDKYIKSLNAIITNLDKTITSAQTRIEEEKKSKEAEEQKKKEAEQKVAEKPNNEKSDNEKPNNNVAQENTNKNTCSETYISGILIVNKEYCLPQSYNPGGLTSETSSAFNKMQSDAAKDGIEIYIQSGFRSYEEQVSTHEYWSNLYGEAYADTVSAEPGHSEHQTGMAIDVAGVTKPECNLNVCFETTAEGKWVSEHAHEYGFIIRYPKGKEAITGYSYEPWHLRYVGVDVATDIYNSGITLEEYLRI